MSKTRNIYFVRHGQTDANVRYISQGPDSKLTEHGKHQAQCLGERLRNIPFDSIISSPYARAVHTAEILREYSKHEADIEILEALHERRKPDELEGISSNSDEYRAYVRDMYAHADDPVWRSKNGENFFDLLERCKEVLSHIESQTNGDLVLVSHGFFLRVLIGYLYTQSDDLRLYADVILGAIHLENTGITHVKLTDGHWQFGTINDSTHLS